MVELPCVLQHSRYIHISRTSNEMLVVGLSERFGLTVGFHNIAILSINYTIAAVTKKYIFPRPSTNA